ncbi:MAG: site-specific integrase, partial [Tannerella sp.]|nr:site-specific integrase [Tannerella sp.]
MATLNLKLDKRSANKKGEYPVIIRLIHKREATSISTHYAVKEKDWKGDDIQRPVKTSHPTSQIINDMIEKFYFKLKLNLERITLSGEAEGMTLTELKRSIMFTKEQQLSQEIIKAAKVAFYTFAGNYINTRRTDNTKQLYRNTISKLREYYGKDNLSFRDITLSFLRDFDRHLERSGSGVNSRSIHFRNIRTLFNRAIDDELIPSDLYPFRKFKIRSEQREKDCLTPEQVSILYSYSPATKGQQLARDFWFLSFFFCGINPVDLYHLKRPDNLNRITFTRTKTQHASQDEVRISIQPEAQEIINRYQSMPDSPLLLNFDDHYMTYDIFRHFISKSLREISRKLNLPG